MTKWREQRVAFVRREKWDVMIAQTATGRGVGGDHPHSADAPRKEAMSRLRAKIAQFTDQVHAGKKRIGKKISGKKMADWQAMSLFFCRRFFCHFLVR